MWTISALQDLIPSADPSVNLEFWNAMIAWAKSWWRHQMESFSALLALCVRNSRVPGEFLSPRPVTMSSDVFFDLRLNKRFSKHSWGWWFETLSRPWWRHSNGIQVYHAWYSQLMHIKRQAVWNSLSFNVHTLWAPCITTVQSTSWYSTGEKYLCK